MKKNSKIRLTEKNAVILGLTGAVVWSFLGLLSRVCRADAFMMISVRGMTSALLMILARRSFRIPFTKGNLMGGIGIAATGVLYILALKNTSAANAIALQYAMTAIVLVVTLIREKRGPKAGECLTVLGVLAGVMLCCLPGMNAGGGIGNLFGILSAFTFALVFLTGRRQDADPLAYSYLGYLLCIPFIALSRSGEPALTDLVYMLLMGVCNFLGYLCLGFAMRKLQPVTAAVVSNAEPVLNPIWVYLFYGEFPGYTSFAGAALVLITITLYQALSARRSAAKQGKNTAKSQ